MKRSENRIRRILSGGRITLDKDFLKHLKASDGDYVIMWKFTVGEETRVQIKRAEVS